MQVLNTILLTLQMLSAIIMVGLILVQHGKGADMGAAFGSGSSGSLFGASGSANFMSHATAWLAATFFVCTLALAYFSGVTPMRAGSGSVLDKAPITAPANPAAIPASGAPTAPTGSAVPTPTGVPAPTGVSTTPAAPASAAVGSAVPVPSASASGAAVPVPAK